jgi:hypothetical protein
LEFIFSSDVLNGAIAGMAGITPASGFIEGYWAAFTSVFIVLGAFCGIWLLKGKLKIDDALDVSSVHGITGMIGSISIGLFASQEINPNGPNGWVYGNFSQLYIQVTAVALAASWAIFWTSVLVLISRLKFLKFFKLTVDPEVEALGLDFYYHGDVAYLDLETPELVTEQSMSYKQAGYSPDPATANIQDEETPFIVPSISIDFGGDHDVIAQTIPSEVRRTLSARYDDQHYHF